MSVDQSNAKPIAVRLIGYGVLHLVGSYMVVVQPDLFSATRLFPLVKAMVIAGPLLFAAEIYFRFLRKGKYS